MAEDRPADVTTPAETSAEKDLGAELAPLNVAEGMQIDRYILGAKLGEGGMGTVFAADQMEPVQRRVALKVIQVGMDTKRLLRRFEAERRILALLDHPNVSTMLDAGSTPSGRPYFVMEFVDGLDIDEFCSRRRLTIRQRVDLFLQVLAGVEHAHQKGIIHRDLKPSNILVSEREDRPQPHIIDFGIAKSLGGHFYEDGLLTKVGEVFGTPRYMCPEQADLASDNLDVRSDIFSLGAILYELLVGVSPFAPIPPDRDFKLEVSTREAMAPTQGLKQYTNKLRLIADERRISVSALRKAVSGDVASVIFKALKSDRRERYRSVSEFADDLRRYLDGYPVIAKPRRFWYLAGRFAARRKGLIAWSTVLVLMLIGTAVTAVIGFLRAEQSAAEANLIAEFQAKQLAEIDAAQMGLGLRRGLLDESRTAQQRRGLDGATIGQNLMQLEAQIAGANFTNLALELLDESIFDRALKVIDAEFSDQPLVQAQLRQTVASTLKELGLFDSAGEPQRQALDTRRRLLGDEHLQTLESVNYMGLLLQEQGKRDEAEPHYRESLQASRRVLGDRHRHTLAAIHNMGALLYLQGKLEEAEPYQREALKTRSLVLGDEHPDTLQSMNNLGLLLTGRGELDEAQTYYRKALDASRRSLGDEDPQTLTLLSNIGQLLMAQGKPDEAEPYHREALETRRRVLGDEHPDTLSSIASYGAVLETQGRFVAAEPYYREALDASRRVLGDEHPGTLAVINNMGYLLESQGKLDQAEPYYREALGASRRVLGDEHPDTLGMINNMGILLKGQGKLDEAEPYLRESLEGARRILGGEHEQTLRAINNLALLLSSQGKLDEAEPYLREGLGTIRRVLGNEHPGTLFFLSNLGSLLVSQGKLDQAEPYLREALESRRRLLGNEHPSTLDTLMKVSDLERDLGNLTQAESLGREASETALEVLGEAHAMSGRILVSYGRTLVDLGQHERAKEIIEHSYVILSKPGIGGEPHVKGSIEGMVALYERWHEKEPDRGYKDSAEQWRRKLEALPQS